MKAIWNSVQGYSLKDEVVTILATDAATGLVHIHTEPDKDEPTEGFSYWVPTSELAGVSL